MDNAFATILREGPNAPSEDSIELMWAHWLLVKDWNTRVNLTSIKKDSEAAWLHYQDSLSAQSFIDGGPIVDMGSGGGFPGVPLAIIFPELQVTLVEPRRKRASFQRVVAARLGLKNVTVLNGRSTDTPPTEFAALVTRATFSNLSDIQACLRWLSRDGSLVAYRSADSDVLPGVTTSHFYSLAEHDRRLDILNQSE